LQGNKKPRLPRTRNLIIQKGRGHRGRNIMLYKHKKPTSIFAMYLLVGAMSTAFVWYEILLITLILL